MAEGEGALDERVPLPSAWIESITDPSYTGSITTEDIEEAGWQQEQDGDLTVYRYRGHKIQYDPDAACIVGYQNWREEQIGTWYD